MYEALTYNCSIGETEEHKGHPRGLFYYEHENEQKAREEHLKVELSCLLRQDEEANGG